MTGRRRIVINVAFFGVLFAVMLGWATRNIISVDALERPYEIAAEFPNAFGVLPNSEVTYLGVAYGRVATVERIPGGVRIGMQIDRGKLIPEGSTAGISRKSAIGEQYVDFVPPDGDGGNGPYYRPGTVLPQSKTTVPLEFSELLRSAGALIESLPPADVESLVDELAAALDGRGEDLAALADAGDRLSASLASRTEALDRLATNGTRLTAVLAEHGDDFGATLRDLALVAESLRNAKGDLTTLLDSGGPLLGRLADLVSKHKGNLDCSLKALDALTLRMTTPERLAGLTALLEIGPRAFAGVWDSRDVEADGVWLRVGFVANRSNPPAQYVPPKELPPVGAVQVCASPLRASGVDYRPAAEPAGPELPATGGAAAVAGLVVLASGLLAHRIRARRP